MEFFIIALLGYIAYECYHTKKDVNAKLDRILQALYPAFSDSED